MEQSQLINIYYELEAIAYLVKNKELKEEEEVEILRKLKEISREYEQK